MADILSQVRDALIQIALDHPRFRFKDGTINASALARELGVDPSTVNRVLHGKRNLVSAVQRGVGIVPQYQPSAALLDGIARLTGCGNWEEVWAYILDAGPRFPQKPPRKR